MVGTVAVAAAVVVVAAGLVGTVAVAAAVVAVVAVAVAGNSVI